jgi:hypothetical protein
MLPTISRLYELANLQLILPLIKFYGSRNDCMSVEKSALLRRGDVHGLYFITDILWVAFLWP